MNKENIILFGASRLGEIAFNVLKDRYNICYFSDNDKNKWGKLFCGITIIAPEELANFNDTKIIIASMYYGEISAQLKNRGLDNIYIFSYVDINDKTNSKKYFIDKMCDLNIYNNLKLDEDFKSKFVNNFSLIYGNDNYIKNNNFKKLDNGKKNVLIIAYFFPPLGGSGVQRTLKFVKYLKKYGWNPVVVTVGDSYSSYEKDYSLIDEVPGNLEVCRINHEHINSEQLNYDIAQQIFNLIYGLINEQNIIKQYILKIKEKDCEERFRIFEPDLYVSWVNKVLQDIERLIDIKKIDIIYTTSGPYSDHFVGYYVKKKYNIPWVVDFRDEWTNNHFSKEFYKNNKYRLQLHRCMEEEIVGFADKIITVSPISSENYRNIFKLQYDKVITITNGYDEEDFKHIINDKSINNKFKILFYGSLYLSNSYLDYVIIAINKLIEEMLIDKNFIEIRLIGKIDLAILNIFEQIDKYKIIKYEEYKPHLECLFEASKSNLLLLPIGKGDVFLPVYTGKVFEYVRLMIPILSISPKGSVVEDLLKETNCGSNFEHGDLLGIKTYILKQYKMWILGEYNINANETKIKEFERKKLTKILSEVFNSLT